MTWKIPLFNTQFGQAEIDAVEAVIRSGWLTMGERVLEFESAFAACHGAKHAVAVNNCTAALHLAVSALDLGEGDEVICPSLTFVATSNAIRYCGATPVFADIDGEQNWNISLESIKKCLTPRTKGIMVVHYAGYPCDMAPIKAFAKQNNLKIIEDCAHAPGTVYLEKCLGTWGDVGCFSFFSNKNMSTGEGGMVITDDDKLAEKIRLHRSHGMSTVTLDRHKGHAFSYDVTEIGYNYRPTEITAALGLVQLQSLSGRQERRKELVRLYQTLFSETSGKIGLPFGRFDLTASACHIMPVLLPEGMDRPQVMSKMKDRGIQTSIHYPPIHKFVAYQDIPLDTALPVTEKVSRSCLTLPLFPEMSDNDVSVCVRSLSEIITGAC